MTYDRNTLEVIAANHGATACPFCGHSPDIADDDHGFGVHCINPECSIGPAVYFDNEPEMDAKPQAIAAWNQRAADHGAAAGEVEATAIYRGSSVGWTYEKMRKYGRQADENRQRAEVADAVAKMAAHDRDEALVNLQRAQANIDGLEFERRAVIDQRDAAIERCNKAEARVAELEAMAKGGEIAKQIATTRYEQLRTIYGFAQQLSHNHSGDEETGEHDPDCEACIVEAIITATDETAEQPAPRREARAVRSGYVFSEDDPHLCVCLGGHPCSMCGRTPQPGRAEQTAQRAGGDSEVERVAKAIREAADVRRASGGATIWEDMARAAIAAMAKTGRGAG